MNRIKPYENIIARSTVVNAHVQILYNWLHGLTGQITAVPRDMADHTKKHQSIDTESDITQ